MKRIKLFSLSSITMLMLASLLFFYSCEKGTLMEGTKPETIEAQQLQRLNTEIATKDISPMLEDVSTGEVDMRSNSQSVFSTSGSVGQGQLWAVYIPAYAMQIGYKYTAVVTPTSGDPDLYIYRYSPWSYLRRSINGGSNDDSSYVSHEDMLANNNRGYFLVYGYTAATFNIEIFKEPLYPTAEIGDDYPYDGQNSLCHSTNGCTPDTWGMCEDNCTSWVTFKINQVNGYSQTNLSSQYSYPFYNYVTGTGNDRLSNAHRWDERLASIGVVVDGTATPGSICNWEATSGNFAGHVAYVHSVSSDGTITISEYNYSPLCEYNTRILSPSNSKYPDHFIHVERYDF